MDEQAQDHGSPFVAGDVVELKSGSFPMTLMHEKPRNDGDNFVWWCVCWDQNGVAGRSQRLAQRLLPAASLKRFVPYEEREGHDNIPF